MAPIRLTIFEDNRAFRESLQQLFRITKDVEVVGAYSDCSRLRDALLASQPEVILMDIDMPGMTGIEATAEVKAFNPNIQVVMLTVSEEEDRIFQCLQNGATGYLLKKAGPDEIIEAVRSVYAGGSPISPAIARKVLQFFHQPKPDNPRKPPKPATETTKPNEFTADLTPREKEILEGLVDGLSYKMIAARFNISPETVKNHIQGIYKKLHVNSKGEAISLVLKSGGMQKKNES